MEGELKVPKKDLEEGKKACTSYLSSFSPVSRFPRITSLASKGIIVPSASTIGGMRVWRPSCGDCRADSTSYKRDQC